MIYYTADLHLGHVNLSDWIRDLNVKTDSSEFMRSVRRDAVMRIARTILTIDLSTIVETVLKRIGFDPDDFRIVNDSVSRIVTEPDLLTLDWNGPWYDAEIGGYTVRAATQMILHDDGDVDFGIEVFRIGNEDDHWQVWKDNHWDLDGPEAWFFDEMLYGAEEDDDEDDDVDESYYDNDHSLTMLSVDVATYNALDAAGIQTMDDLTEMTKDQILGIPNMSESGLESIISALADEGLELKK